MHRLPDTVARLVHAGALAIVLAGCDSGSSAPPESVETPAPAPPVYARALDEAAVAAYREPFVRIAGTATPHTPTGWLGRNAQWGGMYSPRFQLGAGHALRTHLAVGNVADARAAFSAIEAAMPSIGPSGAIASSVPQALFPGVTLSDGDVASGAAFFLGDACLGMLALQGAAQAEQVATAVAREAVRSRLALAIGWLRTREALLQAYDGRAPNRLLFDGLAFHACGVLAGDERARSLAASFVGLALTTFDPRGFFVEDGGHDTNYQAVAIQQGNELIVAGFADARLREALARAAGWLGARVRDDGRVDSSGNTRTCGGGESFLGEPKRISLVAVFAAMVYAGQRAQDAALLRAAERVYQWVRSNPGIDPCFPA
jgi:hypothetical protein